MNFIKNKLNRENFYLLPTVLKFGDLLEGWKLATNAEVQLIISKSLPAKKHRDMGRE